MNLAMAIRAEMGRLSLPSVQEGRRCRAEGKIWNVLEPFFSRSRGDPAATSPFEQFVVDGELVIELNGRLPLMRCRRDCIPRQVGSADLSEETPARLILFDMLVGPDGSAVGALPLTERRSALEVFGEKAAIAGKLIVTPCTRDLAQATQWLDDFDRDGRDGVVAKRLDGKYLSGERAMIKVKRLRTADCVVGGFRYQSGSA